MALRSAIAANDCIAEYEQAAQQKLEAGFTLLAAGLSVGVEVLALAVEMLLKAALFRFLGYSGAQAVAKQNLDDLRLDIIQAGVTSSNGGTVFHDLQFLADGLVAVRKDGLAARSYGSSRSSRHYNAVAASPMAAEDASNLTQCSMRLMTNWSINDRYKSTALATKDDLENVFDEAFSLAELYDAGRM